MRAFHLTQREYIDHTALLTGGHLENAVIFTVHGLRTVHVNCSAKQPFYGIFCAIQGIAGSINAHTSLLVEQACVVEPILGIVWILFQIQHVSLIHEAEILCHISCIKGRENVGLELQQEANTHFLTLYHGKQTQYHTALS